MLIDGFTVFAQLVNFLILIALLKRFLYRPILKTLNRREKQIAGQILEARNLKTEAERQCSEYREKNEQFERQRGAMIAQAQQDAEAERQTLIEGAKVEIAALRNDWLKALKTEQSLFKREIMRLARSEVLEITRKVMSDMASESLEQRICESFGQHLQSFSESEKKTFASAVRAKSEPLTLTTAFALTAAQQQTLGLIVTKVFEIDVPIDYLTDTKLICGIELCTGGYKLSWHVDDYLRALEQNLDRALATKTAVLGG
ncbi:MAG: F0F1 ATP synthase subunit B family protein [Gammaproteobacteria bacterium]